MNVWFKWLLGLSLRNYRFTEADLFLATRAQRTTPHPTHPNSSLCLYLQEMSAVIRSLERFCLLAGLTGTLIRAYALSFLCTWEGESLPSSAFLNILLCMTEARIPLSGFLMHSITFGRSSLRRGWQGSYCHKTGFHNLRKTLSCSWVFTEKENQRRIIVSRWWIIQ